MFFQTSLTIPALTLEDDPVEQTLNLGPGRITQWWIGFPSGCAGLAHLTVWRFEHQILPEGEGESIAWNDHMFRIQEDREFLEDPLEVTLRGWNLDDSYPHTVFVGVTVLPIPEETTESLLRRLLGALVGV